jgi:hypothetical protein
MWQHLYSSIVTYVGLLPPVASVKPYFQTEYSSLVWFGTSPSLPEYVTVVTRNASGLHTFESHGYLNWDMISAWILSLCPSLTGTIELLILRSWLFPILKMEAAFFPETLVVAYQFIRRNFPKDLSLQIIRTFPFLFMQIVIREALFYLGNLSAGTITSIVCLWNTVERWRRGVITWCQ